MKRLCTVAGLMLASVAGAQTQKGNGLISGDVSISHSRANDQRGYANRSASRSTLKLTAGRFVADNWLVGGHVSGRWGFGKSENSVPVGQGQRIFSERNVSADVYMTPFVRRYWQFAPVQVFAGAGLSVGINGSYVTNQDFTGTAQQIVPIEQRNNALQVSPYLEAGVNYFLTNRLSLQLLASTRSLPLDVANISTGLVYWTGTDRKATLQPERENVQTNRSNWIVEGGFSAIRASANNTIGTVVDQSTSHGFSISPSVGYFISKNNLLGISIPVRFNTVQTTGQNPQFSTSGRFWSVGVSPYFQHYWTSTRLTPYTRASATYFLSESRPDNENTNSVSVNAALSIGLAYMAGQRFIIETSLSDATLTYRPSYSSRNDPNAWSAGLSAGLRGSFAVRYVLTRAN